MMIRLFGRKLRTYIRHLLQYKNWIGLADALIFVYYEVLNIKIIKTIRIGREVMCVRTGTSDISVAANCLVREIYGTIKCQKAKVIIDAGANIGASAIFFARKFPDAYIFAIEPEHTNFNLLLENVKKYENIFPIKAALWDEKCTKILKDRKTGPWGYTVAETHNDIESTGQEIDCISMEMIIREHNLDKVDILKLDIEGGEKKVFEASSDWIDKVNIIAAELHDRICMGSDRAFYLATKDFRKFEKFEELVMAYRFEC